jgi:hypothetical protein
MQRIAVPNRLAARAVGFAGRAFRSDITGVGHISFENVAVRKIGTSDHKGPTYGGYRDLQVGAFRSDITVVGHGLLKMSLREKTHVGPQRPDLRGISFRRSVPSGPT